MTRILLRFDSVWAPIGLRLVTDWTQTQSGLRYYSQVSANMKKLVQSALGHLLQRWKEKGERGRLQRERHEGLLLQSTRVIRRFAFERLMLIQGGSVPP